MNRAEIVAELEKAFGTDAAVIANDLIGDFTARMPNTSIYGMKSLPMAIARLIDHSSKIGEIDTDMAEYWKGVQAHYYKIVPNTVAARPLSERKVIGADYVAPVFVPQSQAETETETKSETVSEPEVQPAKQAKRTIVKKGAKVDQFD